MGVIELVIAVVFFLGIPAVMAVMFTFIILQNRKLAKHKCVYCSAPVSPRATNCATCGEPCPTPAAN